MPTPKTFRKQSRFFQKLKKHFQQQQCLLILFLLLSACSQRLGGAVRNARLPFQRRGFQRDRPAPCEAAERPSASPGGLPGPCRHARPPVLFRTSRFYPQHVWGSRCRMRLRGPARCGAVPQSRVCRDTPGPPTTLGVSHPATHGARRGLLGRPGAQGGTKPGEAARAARGAAVTSAHTPRPHEEAVLPPPLRAAGAGTAPPPTGGCGGLPVGPGPVLREGRGGTRPRTRGTHGTPRSARGWGRGCRRAPAGGAATGSGRDRGGGGKVRARPRAPLPWRRLTSRTARGPRGAER